MNCQLGILISIYPRLMNKILVIEDEVSVGNNIQEILESGGFDAIVVDSGYAGVELAKTYEPALIICDIMMPNFNGYAVLKALQEHPLTAKIPFIFLTAKAAKNDVRQGMNLGADDYLTKPFRRTELLKAIRARLDKKAMIIQPYETEQQRLEELQKKVEEYELMSDRKDKLMKQLIEDLRNPLSQISLAIHMLKKATTKEQRDRYIQILQKEFAREINLLNKLAKSEQIITTENVSLLREFNLIQF